MAPTASNEKRSVWSEALSKAQSVKVRNVMNPLLWLDAVAMPLLLTASYLFKDVWVLSVPMGLVAVALPIWTMLEYRYFARTDPKRLHSEEYLLAQQRLMIESKSSTQAIDASLLPVGENPEVSFDEPASRLPHIDAHSTRTEEGGN